MSKKKGVINKGMEKIMLNCDQATYFVTKSEFESLGCIRKMQLKMHLAYCKFCRRFAQQNKIISEVLEDFKQVDQEHLHIRLSEEQQTKLKETIESEIKK